MKQQRMNTALTISSCASPLLLVLLKKFESLLGVFLWRVYCYILPDFGFLVVVKAVTRLAEMQTLYLSSKFALCRAATTKYLEIYNKIYGRGLEF